MTSPSTAAATQPALAGEAARLLERVADDPGRRDRDGQPVVCRRDRRRRPRPPVRDRPLAHPGRGDVPALRLVPGLQPDRRAVDDVPHPGRGRQRPAPGDVHRAHARPGRGHPVQLPVRARRRDDGVLGERPDGRARRDGARGAGPRAAGHRRDVGRAVHVRGAGARGRQPAARGGRPRHRPVHAPRRRPRRPSTASTPRSAPARPSARSPSSMPSRSGPPSSSWSAGRCHRSSPARARWARSGRGTCSTKPIESMRGGSPVRSTSEEVGDEASTCDALMSTGAQRRAAGQAMEEETSHMNRIRMGKSLVATAAIAVIVAACSSGGGATTAPSAAAPTEAPASVAGQRAGERAGQRAGEPPSRRSTYKIGYSNGGGVGNGFREEQVCTAKAEALASGAGLGADVNPPQHRCGRPAADIRDLIAAGVDAIVFNPNDPEALNPALDEAKAAGIKTVAVDAVRDRPGHLQPVQQPGQVRRARRQVAVRAARRHGQRLVHSAASPATRADTDRDIGFKNALKDYPNIKVVPNEDGVVHQVGPGDHDPGHQRLHRQRRLRHRSTGIWTSGMDKQIDRRDQGRRASRSCRSSARTVGGFVAQLLDPTDYPGLEGRGRDQHRRRRRRGRRAGAQAPQRRDRRRPRPTRRRPNTVLLDPVLVDNLTDDGQGRSSRPGSRSPGSIRCGRSACRSTAGRTYDPEQVPAPARAPDRPTSAPARGSPAPPAAPRHDPDTGTP